MYENLLISCFIFLLSGVFHGSLGFGFPMLSTPLLTTFMSIKEAVLTTIIPTIGVNASSVKSNGSLFDIWKQYKWLLISVLFGSIIGTNLLILVDTEYFKLLLAFVLLLYLNKKSLNFSLTSVINQHPVKIMLAFGLMSGFVGGIVNVMIPVIAIYVLELNLKKENGIAIMNSCFMTSKSVQFIAFSSYGYYTLETFLAVIPLLGFSLLGLFFGNKIKNRINEKNYKRILHIVLWLMCGHLVISTFV